MSSRLVQALAVGELIITNQEQVSVGVTLCKTLENGKIDKSVRLLRPGKEVNLTRLYSIQDLRKSPQLMEVVSKRRIHIKDTWSG